MHVFSFKFAPSHCSPASIASLPHTDKVLKVAVTLLLLLIVNVHALPEHAPDQPAKTKPDNGVAVKLTFVPDAYDSIQSEPQLMPAGLLVIEPEPDLLTLSV